MTQEDKELLLEDLCARLPYGVKVRQGSWIHILESVNLHTISFDHSCAIPKPYLRPMSSMTEEEIGQYKLMNDALDENYEVHIDNAYPAFDWLNEHHFDYRGLINIGLALEAPEGMYTKNK